MNRADFHAQNLDSAREEAQRLFARKHELQGAWLSWVASQIYALQPATYASMVRRELQSLQEKSESLPRAQQTPEKAGTSAKVS